MMRLPAGLRSNLGLKLLSIALALLLWFFVHGAKVIEREQRIPIRYVNLPDSLMFLEPPPQEMRVLLSGPTQEMILHVNVVGSVAARIDLIDATPALDRVVPSLADIDAPASERVSVVRILAPSVIALRLARRVERDIPVRLTWVTEGKSGYCLADSPHVEPARVACVGPEPLLSAQSVIPTQTMTLPARRGSATQEIALGSPSPLVQCFPERVRVTVAMERRRNVTLAHVPLTVVPPAHAGWRVELETLEATVTLTGPEPRLESLVAGDLGLFLDASRLAPGHHEKVPVIPQLPPWVDVVTLEPSNVPLNVRTQGSAAADGKGRPRSGTELP